MAFDPHARDRFTNYFVNNRNLARIILNTASQSGKTFPAMDQTRGASPQVMTNMTTARTRLTSATTTARSLQQGPGIVSVHARRFDGRLQNILS